MKLVRGPFVKIAGMRPEDRSGEMAARIKALVYEYSEKMPVATAVGVLEIVKAEILDETP